MSNIFRNTGQIPNFLKPFKIIAKVKPIFLIWFLVIIFFSHLGIILSFIIYKKELIFQELLIKNLQQGNLYNISIALCASYLAIIIVDIISCKMQKKENHFLIYKMGGLVLLFIIIVLMAMLYTTTLFENQIYTDLSTNVTNEIDLTQILFYLASIISIIYLFCLTHLEYDLGNYLELQDDNLKCMMEGAKSASDDGRGNKL